MAEQGLQVRIEQAGPPGLQARFDCARGEVLAVIGPSGGGKTSLLRALAGVLTPASGCIRFDGQPWLDTAAGINLKPRDRSVGWVAQHYGLFPHLSAEHNVMCAMLHRALPERRARAQELLARLRLEGLAKRRPAELSGGQQQRVAVARALARNPRLLLLDEPFSAVDRATRRELYREIQELQRAQETTVVLVTHDLREARMLGSLLAVMDQGRILQVGARTEVSAHPSSVRVAEILDTPNLFSARVLACDLAAGSALLQWESLRIEARAAPWVRPDMTLGWTIPPGRLRLAAAGSNAGNTIDCVVEDVRPESDPVDVRLRCAAASDWLRLQTPAPVWHQEGKPPGASVRIEIPQDDIRLIADTAPEP